MATLGLIFPPGLPPELLRSVARSADEAGLEQLWLWEDCFAESGIAAAAAVLGWTQRVGVGIGLLPVPLRNVALTAMELATLHRLFPGRLLPGIGHGVLDWMGQAGARVASPMTLLGEYTSALRALLRGERLTVSGRYVRLDDVALAWPPEQPLRLLLGAVGRKTLALAGSSADGVILTGGTTPQMLREARAEVMAARRAAAVGGEDGEPDVVAFVPVDTGLDAVAVAGRVREYIRGGATHVAVLAVGDGEARLADYAGFLAGQVRPLLSDVSG